MGFFSVLNKAVDAVDNTVTNARVRHGAQSEASKFAASVRPGHTYYSVVICHTPWGDERALMEFRFDRRGRDGHMTAAGAWLSYGPLHDRRPGGGLMTFREMHNKRRQFPPNAEDAMRAAGFDITPAGV
ncbi:MAG: hypothetical protein HOW97_18015 [Catenulispora sp.]|nr:hypothetical protein [Catenulispora sp.]